jgi:hypothetical protein
MLARLAVFQAYEQARQAAADAREWVVQCERLPTLARDPVALAEALRALDPRCLAPDRRHDAGDLLWRLIEGPVPSEAELRKVVQVLTRVGRGRRPDLFVDALVRGLARWWRAVTGEIPPLTRNPVASARGPATDAPPHFLDFINAACTDAGGPSLGLPELSSTARRVGETIRAEDKEGQPGWVIGDASWSPRFRGGSF